MFKWLKGSTVDKAVDGIMKGADALVLTDEERIEYNQKAMSLWLDIQKVTANESSTRSVTRRVLAWAIMFVGLFSFLLACTFGFVVEGYGDFIAAKASDWRIGELMIAVTVFYFGTHIIGRLKEK